MKQNNFSRKAVAESQLSNSKEDKWPNCYSPLDWGKQPVDSSPWASIKSNF